MASLLHPAPKPRKSLSKRSLLAKPFKISQLDGSAPRRAEIRVIKRRASVELIAEQYQAFLESRYTDDTHSSPDELDQARVVPMPVLQESPTFLLPNRYDPRASNSAEDTQSAFSSPTVSPASSAGTLVDFEAVDSEKDVIYFRPVSCPERPVHRSRPGSQGCDKPLPRPPPSVEPLHTAVSLVIDELTTALPRPPSSGSQSPSLEINTMIEVYERVRGQLSTSEVGSEQASVRAMFDCWLAALHTMHRRSYADDVLNDHPAYRRPHLTNRRIIHQRGISASVL